MPIPRLPCLNPLNDSPLAAVKRYDLLARDEAGLNLNQQVVATKPLYLRSNKFYCVGAIRNPGLPMEASREG
jgi:hypothetical protein